METQIYLQLGQGQWFELDELKETLETEYNDSVEYGGEVLVTDSANNGHYFRCM